jgi:hypothetical protein
MARSFTSAFTTRMLEAHQRPYLVLEIQWGGDTGTKYYIDRPAGTFEATGTRIPTVEAAYVVDWGTLGQSLKEMQVGAVDTITLKLEDRAGIISAILSGTTPQQRKTVKIYRLFDENDTVWPTDAALVFIGITKPFSYSETDNVISFSVEDPARQLIGTTECLAREAIFTDIPQDSVDKNIPLVWGKAERVPAVLVARPWETRFSEPFNLFTGIGSRFDVDDHPDEIHAPLNTELECYVGPKIGEARSQIVKGQFRRSVNKAEFASQFEITGLGGVQTVDARVGSVANEGSGDAIATIYLLDGIDEYLEAHIFSTVVPGRETRLWIKQGATTRAGLLAAAAGLGGGAYEVRFNKGEINENLTMGQVVRFGYRRLAVVIDDVADDMLTDVPGYGDGRYVYINQDDISPAGFFGNLNDFYTLPIQAQVYQSGIYRQVDILAIDVDAPSTGTYRLKLGENGFEQLNNLAAGQELDIGFQSVPLLEFPAGSTLWPVTGDWIYACNALPSKQILRVEGYGDTSDQGGTTGRKDFIPIADRVNRLAASDAGSYIYTSAAWTANLVNGTWDKTGTGGAGTASDLGRKITTITFTQPPRLVDSRLDSNDIWVTLKGVENVGNGSGVLITNPALVLLNYLTNPKLMNIDGAYVNSASFTTAAARQELVTRRVGFAQLESVEGIQLLQDIARQCRSTLFFDQGKFSLTLLQNETTTWAATFDEDSILENTLAFNESDAFDMPTRLTATWRYRWDDKSKPRKRVATNPGAEETFLPINKEFELWLYANPDDVQREVEFWLARWSRIYREVTFTTFGRALVLQPGDWIKLSYIDGTDRELVPAETKCEVLEVKDKAPTGLIDVKCRYPQFSF